MYESINVIPISVKNLTEEQQKIIVDLPLSINQTYNNIAYLFDVFSEAEADIGIYSLVYNLEQILIALNTTNTIEPDLLDLRLQSIGTKEMLSIEQHSIRMFNNEATWITSYGTLGYYLSFITARNASYLTPSEQSYYGCICLLKLYDSLYKPLSLALTKEEQVEDDFIYDYISYLVNQLPEVATLLRHLKIFNKYKLSKYGANYFLDEISVEAPIQFLFQTLSINYCYYIQDIYLAIQAEELVIPEIPLEETVINPLRAMYTYNDSLIGPGGLHTLILVLASSLIRRAHYLCHIDFILYEKRIDDLISKACSLLYFDNKYSSLAEEVNKLTSTTVLQYRNKWL